MNDEELTIPDSNASEGTDDSGPLRPNRWQGAHSTWTSLTAPERSLAASLDQIRNADLSIHLYNAHALKRRARAFEENPYEVRKEYPAIPDEDQTFTPPKSWTAWPLPPNEVPRESERIGPKDPDEKYTFKRREVERPSRELEDVLVGLTLRFARERFEGREEVDDIEYDDINDINRQGAGDLQHSKGAESRDSEMSNAEESMVVKEGSTPPAEEPLIPTVSIDDDRSRTILRPSIRRTLAKLDEVLMALHHARKACRRFSYSSASSEADTEADGSPSPTQRLRGRPRKFSDLPNRSRAQSMPSEQEMDESGLFRAKTTHLGRPFKTYERLEGESQQDYIVRIARIQKRPLPAFAPPREPKLERTPTPSPEKTSGSPGRRLTSEEMAERRRRRLQPRDWSEVLASAALVSFPPEVIARATQRCANLFGEGMAMRTIVETQFLEKVPDTVARYVPEAVPDLEGLGDSSDERDSSETSSSEEEEQIKDERPSASILRKSRIPPSKQRYFCSMPDCPRMIQGFRDNDALRRHLELGHKIKKGDVDDYILPSDEEIDGGVHIDGFLKPLKKLGGAGGAYKKVKKRTTEDEEDSGEEGPKVPKPTLANMKVEREVESNDSGDDSSE